MSENQSLPPRADLPSHDFVILGFPKCGTSSLCRMIEKAPHTNVARNDRGTLECDISAVGFVPNDSFYSAGKLNGHKFSAYAFSKRKLESIAAWSPEAKFIICVREPVRVLLSWHLMYRKIASRGKPVNHKAVVERDFFSSCTADDFFYHFARQKLRYGAHLSAVIKVIGAESLFVISQERQAKDPKATEDLLESILGIEMAKSAPRVSHVSSAERLHPSELISHTVLHELELLQTDLKQALAMIPDSQKVV